jgi:hypothetical protein
MMLEYLIKVQGSRFKAQGQARNAGQGARFKAQGSSKVQGRSKN